MRNLLQETVQFLQQCGKTPADVLWVGSKSVHFTWDEFAAIAATAHYSAVAGSPNVAIDIIIVGDDWWLERDQYRNTEWWDFKRVPVKPDTHRPPLALTIDQAILIGSDVSSGWEKLDGINNAEESDESPR